MNTTSPIVQTAIEQINYIDILQLLGFGAIVFIAAMAGSWLADYIMYRIDR